MTKHKRINLIGEVCGWLGIILIQSSTLPSTIGRILDPNSVMPPLSMVLLVWIGLFLFLIRAIVRKDTLYIVSNSIGFFLQSILLSLIVIPHVSFSELFNL